MSELRRGLLSVCPALTNPISEKYGVFQITSYLGSRTSELVKAKSLRTG